MMESRAASLSLVGGALALDFANTASDRGTPRAAEHLREPRHLLEWAAHAGAVRPDDTERLRGALSGPGGPGLLREALGLREAVYSIGRDLAAGAQAPRPAADALLRAAHGALAEARLWPDADGRYRLDFSGAPAAAALLGPVAWSMIVVMAEGGFDRLKQCPGCGWLFRDRSKNNSRRWCDMATCGNVAKGRRHRATH